MSPWRGVAPVQLVIVIVGAVLMTSLLGIIVLSFVRYQVPDELGTVCIASMTGLAGLLTPNSGLTTDGRTARRAAAAGQAAAAAIVASHDQDVHDRELHKEIHDRERGQAGP